MSLISEFKEFASSFLSDVVNFIFMAFVLFCLLKAINKLTSIGHKAEADRVQPCTKLEKNPSRTRLCDQSIHMYSS